MKENPLDFALWKAAKPGEPSWGAEANPENKWAGEPAWKYGAGRPGWHIECSAMIRARYPEGVDVHGGGLDLTFPHHENEIAQSEACNGHPLANYWVHSGLLVFGKEKMSKSLGNIVTTHAFLEKYDGEVLRLMTALQHYRSPVDFSEESILRAEGLLDRLYVCKEHASTEAAPLPIPGLGTAEEVTKKIEEALFDDFNTAKALGFVLQAARASFRENSPGVWASWGRACLPVFAKVFNLLQKPVTPAREAIRCQRLARMGVSEEFSREVDATLSAREAARAAKNYAESDRIRDELQAKGILVMDGPDGATWTVAPKA
jgi:cysteinyl-tRNA synthetase